MWLLASRLQHSSDPVSYCVEYTSAQTSFWRLLNLLKFSGVIDYSKFCYNSCDVVNVFLLQCMLLYNKCTKLQFIQVLTAKCSD